MSWTKQKLVKKNKKDYNRENKIRHSMIRARQRCNMNLGYQDILQIAKKIRTGDSIFIEKKSRTRTLHLVEHKGKEILAGYDKTRKIVTTILPRNARQYKELVEDKIVQNVSGEYAAGGSN